MSTSATIIDLDQIAHVGFDNFFMEREFDPDKLVTIEEEGLTVIHNGVELPGHFRTMKTDTEYIFRILPQGPDDGFNIYRAPRQATPQPCKH